MKRKNRAGISAACQLAPSMRQYRTLVFSPVSLLLKALAAQSVTEQRWYVSAFWYCFGSSVLVRQGHWA